jgi:3-oxoacyl-[acyl-carrier protein] reductase
MTRQLEGKAALVTGAARGIGREYALRLAKLGANVAVMDVDLHSYAAFEAETALMTADTTVDEVRELGVDSIGFEASVANQQAVENAVAEITERWSRLDIAVCNAGGGVGALTDNRASEISLSDMAEIHERNLLGTVITCNAVAPIMKEQRSGAIVTIASTDGLLAYPHGGYAPYCVAKAGVIMYTRCLAQELGEYGIRANALAPGWIMTGRLAGKYEDSQGEAMQAIALRRMGTTKDCANALEFLVTDLSSYVTGHVIPVDGGFVKGGI